MSFYYVILILSFESFCHSSLHMARVHSAVSMREYITTSLQPTGSAGYV